MDLVVTEENRSASYEGQGDFTYEGKRVVKLTRKNESMGDVSGPADQISEFNLPQNYTNHSQMSRNSIHEH